MPDCFPVGVSETLKFYIYRLIDPRNGETFYIGKGKGDRVFQHVNAASASDVTENTVDPTIGDIESDPGRILKIERIRAIRTAQLQVIHIIHRHGIEDEKTAYEVEAALIDAFAGLSNLSGGHGSNGRGPMDAQQIIDKYALPSVAPRDGDKLVLININSWEHVDDNELLDRVRYAWRVAEYRVRQADYVLAVIHGVVRGVFKPEKWLRATPENFPGPRFAPTDPSRMGFHGEKAVKEVWEHYVGDRGKRWDNDRRHGQNPILYINC